MSRSQNQTQAQAHTPPQPERVAQRLLKIRRNGKKRLSASRAATRAVYESRLYAEDVKLQCKKTATTSRVSTAVDSEAEASSPCESSGSGSGSGSASNSPASSGSAQSQRKVVTFAKANANATDEKGEQVEESVRAAKENEKGGRSTATRSLFFAFDGVLILLNVSLVLFIVHTLYELVFAHAPINDLASGVGAELYKAVVDFTGVSGAGSSAEDSVGGQVGGRGGASSEIGLLDIEL